MQVGFLGSEAGAVGQCQFMPSNYYQFARRGAEGHAGEEAPDIWDSPEDALASIANFLRAHGYRKGDSFGTLAVLPTDENEADEVRENRRQCHDFSKCQHMCADLRLCSACAF